MKALPAADDIVIHRCFNPIQTGKDYTDIYLFLFDIYQRINSGDLHLWFKGVMVRQMQEHKKRRLVIAER